MPPGDLVLQACEQGLDVVALTDHDTTAGWADAVPTLPAGLTLVRGAELSVRVPDPAGAISCHLLAYLFDPDEPTLRAEMERLRTDRVRRAEAMVARLAELGAPVSWPQVVGIAAGGAVGRPHVARALVDAGVVTTVADAFTPEWIGPGGRAYVRKHAVGAAEAIGLVRAAGGVTVLAHAAAAARGRIVSDADIAALAAAGLAGLEVDHVDHDPAARDRLRRLAADLGLVATGASDFHGTVKPVQLGSELTAPEQYERLVAGATGCTPVPG